MTKNQHRPDTPQAVTHLQAYETLDYLMGMVEATHVSQQRGGAVTSNTSLVLVSGFLGAGKTSLVCNLLTAEHGLKLTAIVNDVASMNIDAAQISALSDDTLALSNGCICCSQSGSLVHTLTSLTQRIEKSDLVIVEGSGVADPWGLAQVAESVPGIELEAVVTVVDATDTPSSPCAYLRERQIQFADIVLVNKRDLVSKHQLTRLIERSRVLAPRAAILATTNSAVPISLVADFKRQPTSNQHTDEKSLDATDDGFETYFFEAASPVSKEALERAIAALPSGILRMKGFLRFSENRAEIKLVQAVGRRWSCETMYGISTKSLGLAVIAQAHMVDPMNLEEVFAGCGLFLHTSSKLAT